LLYTRQIVFNSIGLSTKCVTWGALKLQEWTMQEWTMTEEIAGVDIAGVDNDGVIDSELQL